MKIQFNLEYHTHWGQSVWITGSVAELGNNNPMHAVPMNYADNGCWQAEIVTTNTEFTYRYIVRENGKEDLLEDGAIHALQNIQTPSLTILDRWHNASTDEPFYSSAFSKCIFRNASCQSPAPIAASTLTIRCSAPQFSPTQQLLLSGDCEACGNWDPQHALRMTRIGDGEWEIVLPKASVQLPLHFKFIREEQQATPPYRWEEGDNYVLPALNTANDTSILAEGFHFRHGTHNWKGAGVAIPVFSLRSKEGYGVGEFYDLIPFIDWAVATGQKVIQILPINDTTMSHTWRDSYPYNANSTFALHPLYLRVDKAGTLKDAEKMDDFSKKRDSLNQLPEVDYETVTADKWSYLRQLFWEQGEATLASKEFQHFIKANREWLIPYATFSYLRDKYETPDFHWWDTLSEYDAAEVEKLNQPDSEIYPELAFYYFVQYHLDKQMSEVSAYARQHGIVLKGDIPIGISRTSVDAWCNPQLFHMDCQAGAPPDDFARNGQNWGFPTYNWEVMKIDHFDWWKKRFTKMADYFDAYRIDHILGFFRIWEIPIKSVQGTMGYFNPALPYTADEIRSFGFNFNEELHCKPYIREYFLFDMFGKATLRVIQDFLEVTGWQMFALKKEYDTQREIESNFDGPITDTEKEIEEGLMSLVSEVLFIPAKDQPGKFHPRISAQETKIYASLDPQQKAAYDRLYNYFFYERHNKFWQHEAMEKLPPLIHATTMLACGEDLGMIPKGVKEVLDHLCILSLEVQRMPKQMGVAFDNPQEYPYLSVCTTSTHDMSTMRGWWKETPQLIAHYYHDQLHGSGQAPEDCTPQVCETIINQHLQSPAMFTILPLQDWLSMDGSLRRENPDQERINEPSIPRHYWRYRMHITIDELQHATDFNQRIKQMIQQAQR